MEVRQQERIEVADGHAKLEQADGGAAPGIDQKPLTASLDKRAGPNDRGSGSACRSRAR